MNLENSANRRQPRLLLVALSLVLFVALGTSAAMAQNVPASPASEQELTVTDLLKLPGKLLAESHATRAAGTFKVKNYRLEEVTLAQAQTVEIGGQRVAATKAFRLHISGGPFPVRALPPVIWIDDVAVGYGIESEDLTSITVVTFDASLLREGATLYLSYGDKENKEDRTALPEKLTLSLAKGDQ